MTWSFGPGNPAHAADPRRALPVFSFLPNWAGGITERLMWLTDVLSSETAAEQRRSVRRYPRRTFEASFLRTNAGRSRLDMFFIGVGMGEFLAPLWHEQFYLPTHDPLLATGEVQFPAGSLHMREFRLNDLVIVLDRDPSDFDVMTVIALDLVTDRITLEGAGATKTWPTGTRIIPLRKVHLTDPPQMIAPVDRVATTQLRISLLEPEKFPDANWNFDAPLWQRRPDRSTTVDLDYARTFFELDYQSGVVTRADPGNRAQVGTKIGIKLFGRDRVYRFRQFLGAARGMAVRFYMPTFLRDVLPLGDIEGLTFQAEDVGLSSYLAGPQPARLLIAVVFADGRPQVYREIDTVASVTSGLSPFRVIAEEITLTEPMPPIALHEIERIMFVQPARFDQDGFEMRHHSDDSAAVSTSFVARAMNRDGMPPILSVVTSGPYPLEAVEELASSASVSNGLMMSVPIDELATSADIGDGTLAVV